MFPPAPPLLTRITLQKRVGLAFPSHLRVAAPIRRPPDVQRVPLFWLPTLLLDRFSSKGRDWPSHQHSSSNTCRLRSRALHFCRSSPPQSPIIVERLNGRAGTSSTVAPGVSSPGTRCRLRSRLIGFPFYKSRHRSSITPFPDAHNTRPLILQSYPELESCPDPFLCCRSMICFVRTPPLGSSFATCRHVLHQRFGIDSTPFFSCLSRFIE